MIRIAVDAMGGDNAPGAVVEGCIQALNERNDISVILAGQRDKIEPLLLNAGDARSRIEILDAPDVITMHEAPVMAVRRKPNSSMVKAMDAVKKRRRTGVRIGRLNRRAAGGGHVPRGPHTRHRAPRAGQRDTVHQ